MGKRGRKPKPKPVKVVFIPRFNERDERNDPYLLLDSLMARARPDLALAKIGIAWRRGWKRDNDGLLKLGQCKRRNDLDRSLDEWDFVILLNEEAWQAFNGELREWLLFHELCHAVIETDANGDEKRDAGGRLLTRCRKHDIQEFREVVEQYGWLTEQANAAINDAERPLLTGQGGDGDPTTTEAAPACGPEWKFLAKLGGKAKEKIHIILKTTDGGFYRGQAVCDLTSKPEESFFANVGDYPSPAEVCAELVERIDKYLTDKITDQRRLAIEQKLKAQIPAWVKEIEEEQS